LGPGDGLTSWGHPMDRRKLLASLAGTTAALGLPCWAVALAAGSRSIPQRASARVIVDNDFAGDPDSLIALAHQLLQPKARTVLVTTSALAPEFSVGTSQGASCAAGRTVVLALFKAMRILAPPPVMAGSETLGDPAVPPSPAAMAIVAEALRDDPLPLYLTCGGPLTNVAAALRLQPAIANRMTLVWIGGGPYPEGGWEYNLAADAPAAREVIERSDLPLWQVPQDAYRQMQVSVAELDVRLRRLSTAGAWLYDRFTSPPDFIEVKGSWPLGDSPTVLLTSISAESSHSLSQPARRIAGDLKYGDIIPGRSIRVFDRLDVRLCWEDFLALMRKSSQ
jgi:hypothetical protein